MRSLFVVCATVVLASCSAPSQEAPGTTSLQTDVIRRAMGADLYAAGIRDHQSEVEPPAQAVADYVQSLDDIELEHAPADFAAAMRAHRDAWAALIGPLQAFSSDREQMQYLFDRLRQMPPPTGPQFQSLIGNVTSTWSQVDAAARAGGWNP